MVGAGFFESRAATRVPANATSTQFALLALRELLRHETSTQLAVLALRELLRHRVMGPSFHARPFK